jgi:hypothetical protein
MEQPEPNIAGLIPAHSSPASWIRQALPPARIESDAEDDSLVRVLYPVPERALRILRVIYNETVDPVSIVTAYFDDEVTDL